MHMRTKKWARPELEACPFFINSIKGPDSEPGMLKGTWRNRFADDFFPVNLLKIQRCRHGSEKNNVHTSGTAQIHGDSGCIQSETSEI